MLPLLRLSRVSDKYGLGLVGLIILIYYICVQLFTINIPYGDEFNAALTWQHQFNLKDSVWKKFLFLFSQANEHRLFTYSVAVLTDYSVFGSVNFKRLAWEANLFMILLLYLVNRLNTTDRRNPWIILLIALSLFVPQHEITNWPIVAFAAILQYSLVIGSLWLLSRPGWANLTGAAALATLATFSFGNGMFTFPAGLLVLALKKPGRTAEWLIWTLFMVAVVFLYFQEYKFRGQSGSLTSALLNPIPVIQYFFTFFGTILIRILQVDQIWITLAGLIPIAMLVYLLLFNWKETKKHPAALAILLFFMVSAAVAAISRQKYGIHGATAPRYILMQALFLSVLFLLILNLYGTRIKWLLPGLLCFGILIYGIRLTYGIYALNRHQNHLKQIIVAYNTDPEEIDTHAPTPEIIKRILDRSVRKGIYYPPEITDERKSVTPFKYHATGKINQNLRFNIEQYNYNQGVLKMSGWAFSTSHYGRDLSIGFLLQSEQDNLILPALMVPRENVRQHFAEEFPTLSVSTGFSIKRTLTMLPLQPGTYKLGICILRNQEIIAMKFTGKKLDIPPSP